jgi:hypothetical protein
LRHKVLLRVGKRLQEYNREHTIPAAQCAMETFCEWYGRAKATTGLPRDDDFIVDFWYKHNPGPYQPLPNPIPLHYKRDVPAEIDQARATRSKWEEMEAERLRRAERAQERSAGIRAFQRLRR